MLIGRFSVYNGIGNGTVTVEAVIYDHKRFRMIHAVVVCYGILKVAPLGIEQLILDKE